MYLVNRKKNKINNYIRTRGNKIKTTSLDYYTIEQETKTMRN